MSQEEPEIWGNSDYPYLCLVDKYRTETFKSAIQNVVRPGNTVIDVGSGTGIFSLFAAEAGASKVYSVEIDSYLSMSLHETVKFSPFANIIEVVEGDALAVDLPQNVDVVIAELIETGLMDELQVPVMNKLHEKGIIGPNTKVIPSRYRTNIELLNIDDTYFGYQIKAPKHLWPYYADDPKLWASPKVNMLSNKVEVVNLDLQGQVNDLLVDKTLDFQVSNNSLPINAIRISGVMTLADGIEMGPANTVNGDKVLSLPSDLQLSGDQVRLHVSYKMGAGLGSFKAEPV